MVSKTIYKLASLYTRYFPLGRGKNSLISYVLNSKLPPIESIARAWDGRQFVFNSQKKYAFQIYFHGEREKNETNLMKEIIHKGDIAVDIGANIGWYTTLFSQLVGESGKVIAVEAMPETFNMLKKNLELNECTGNVELLNIMCSDSPGNGVIYNFPALHPGLSSAAPYKNEISTQVTVKKQSLDNILISKDIRNIIMLKIDVEGAEFEVLKGATEALKQGTIKGIMIEANDERSKAFGYQFAECINYALECFPHFELFRIGKKELTLLPINSATGYHHGDNLLMINRKGELWQRLLSLKNDSIRILSELRT
jgi:FkbM family methyltransferase